jgi:haloalkane dehalogenase
MVSAAELEKKFLTVNGKQMAYAEMGSGDAIVFQHGNPTSSYLWRNIMPDDSGPGRYRFAEHREYLFDAWDQLDLGDRVTLVLHDWGSALGFDWARQNADRVAGIAYMEGIVQPVEWTDWPDPAREIFQGFRSEAGESMVLDKNVFVERVLPGSVIRELSEAEMEVYRRPFADGGESRRPTLSWPREIPIGGEPADVVAIVEDYAAWLAASDVPKLFINAEPGAILIGRQREFCRAFPNQREVTVPGIHFIQEDSPAEIAAAIVEWHAECV